LYNNFADKKLKINYIWELGERKSLNTTDLADQLENKCDAWRSFQGGRNRGKSRKLANEKSLFLFT
jgi:hypothetical protein